MLKKRLIKEKRLECPTQKEAIKPISKRGNQAQIKEVKEPSVNISCQYLLYKTTKLYWSYFCLKLKYSIHECSVSCNCVPIYCSTAMQLSLAWMDTSLFFTLALFYLDFYLHYYIKTHFDFHTFLPWLEPPELNLVKTNQKKNLRTYLSHIWQNENQTFTKTSFAPYMLKKPSQLLFYFSIYFTVAEVFKVPVFCYLKSWVLNITFHVFEKGTKIPSK